MAFLIVLGALAWLWLDSLKARDVALQAARTACEHEGLMLLDDTVAICAIRIARDADGRVKLQRSYEFEFSDDGNNRRSGSVVLLGSTVVLFNVGIRDAQLPPRLS